MTVITVFSEKTSPRLIYTLNWIIGEVFNSSYTLTNNEDAVSSLQCFVSYGKYFENALNIPDAGLLWEKGVVNRDITIGSWKDIPTLYHGQSDGPIPFDIFSAIFFLISRHEEYYAYTPDKHGRYPATESILFRRGWLDRPLVDEWLMELSHLLGEKSIPISFAPFRFQPTYDVDIAFSYKHKALRRSIGAIGRSAWKLDIAGITDRVATLLGKRTDPFDCFDWLEQLHKRASIRPVYFVLASLDTTPYDKNIHPLHPKMTNLIKRFQREGQVALHPSYYSAAQGIFERERKALEVITETEIRWSRQHYIRLRIPDTYHSLLAHCITDDWSMGYGDRSGFRAGTGRSFPWYDLQNDTVTKLRIHPFCFMDSTAHYEEQLNPLAAFEELSLMKRRLAQASSTMITVFHNFSLGRAQEWEGWNRHYAQFLFESKKNKPYDGRFEGIA